MRVLWNEIRKSMQMKNTYIYAAVTLAITIFFAGYCVFVSRAEDVNADGSLTIVNGSAAIPVQKNTDRSLSGQVTEEKLKNALQTVQEHYDKTKDEFVYDKEFLNCQRLFGIMNEVNYVYPEFNEETYDSIDQMSQNMADSYYTVRAEKIDKMIDAFYTSEGQKQKAKKMNEKVKVPFSYYEGYGFWNAALEYYTILLVVILIAAALFAAPIFAQDYHSGADLVFRTTKYGRKTLGVCRFIVAQLYGIILFILASLLFLGICTFFFGSEGLQTSIQMMTIYALADMTYGQALGYVIVGGLISVIGTISMIAFFSAKIKSPIVSVIISIAFILVWKIAAMLFSSSAGSVSRLFFMTFPMSGTEMIHSLTAISIFKLFHWYIWEPYWPILTGMFISMVFFFITVYEKKKKKY